MLSSHGETEPLPEVSRWLSRCVKTFGAGNVFILSNKPTAARLDFFNKTFPGIKFISGVRKKPYPDGLMKAVKDSGSAPPEVALLDDRLLTGGLAAILAGPKFLYISKPYINIARRPAKELFFMAVRSAERLFIKIVTIL